MSNLLIFATIAISSALVFYTIGVWSERKSKKLKTWHVVMFWLGLAFDTTGTLIMERLSNSNPANIPLVFSSIHGITGVLAIGLMVFHASWATLVLVKKDDSKKQNFHRLSIIVWMIWLIPYLIGMIIGMSN